MLDFYYGKLISIINFQTIIIATKKFITVTVFIVTTKNIQNKLTLKLKDIQSDDHIKIIFYDIIEFPIINIDYIYALKNELKIFKKSLGPESILLNINNNISNYCNDNNIQYIFINNYINEISNDVILNLDLLSFIITHKHNACHVITEDEGNKIFETRIIDPLTSKAYYITEIIYEAQHFNYNYLKNNLLDPDNFSIKTCNIDNNYFETYIKKYNITNEYYSIYYRYKLYLTLEKLKSFLILN